PPPARAPCAAPREEARASPDDRRPATLALLFALSAFAAAFFAARGAEPPPRGLEQHHACGHRYIKAFHLAAHRDAHQEIAALAREPAHAFPLGAQHPGDRVGEIRFV